MRGGSEALSDGEGRDDHAVNGDTGTMVTAKPKGGVFGGETLEVTLINLDGSVDDRQDQLERQGRPVAFRPGASRRVEGG